MSAKASTLVRQANPGRHTRPPGPAGLRKACVTVLIMLVAQYGLGIFLNLYVAIPASDQHAGLAQEIASGPGSLTLHATLGLILIVASIVLLVRAIAVRSPVIVLLVTLGLSAILGAFAAGEIFVRSGGSAAASLSMAFLTGVALLCYIATLALVSVARHDVARLELARLQVPRLHEGRLDVARIGHAPPAPRGPAPPLPRRLPVGPQPASPTVSWQLYGE